MQSDQRTIRLEEKDFGVLEVAYKSDNLTIEDDQVDYLVQKNFLDVQ
jgi:hypothetical protein